MTQGLVSLVYALKHFDRELVDCDKKVIKPAKSSNTEYLKLTEKEKHRPENKKKKR